MRDHPRTKLVDRMRARLEAGYWPRVHCMLIVTLSTAAAFLTSVLLLVARVDSMALRYGAAALAGYATFLLLLHAWVRWKWSRVKASDDGLDLVDVVSDMPIDLAVDVGRDAARGVRGHRPHDQEPEPLEDRGACVTATRQGRDCRS